MNYKYGKIRVPSFTLNDTPRYFNELGILFELLVYQLLKQSSNKITINHDCAFIF